MGTMRYMRNPEQTIARPDYAVNSTRDFSGRLLMRLTPQPEIMKAFFDRIYRINKMFGITRSDEGVGFFHPVNPVNPVQIFL